MTALVAFLVVVLVGPRLITFVWPRLFGRTRAGRIQQELEARRARRHTEFDLLRVYHDYVPKAEAALDERTWRDLDLDEVFLRVDHAVSEPGRQYLYHLLRSPRDTTDSLDELEAIGGALAPGSPSAERVRKQLSRLADQRSAYLAHLIYGGLPERPWFWWLFPLLTAAAIGSLAAAFVYPRALIGCVVVACINVGIQVLYKPAVERFLPALHEMPALLRAAAALAEIDDSRLALYTSVLRDGARELAGLRRATAWLQFEPEQTNELIGALYSYVNMVFLLDANAFVFTAERIRRSHTTLAAVFGAVGRLDAAASIQVWRRTLPAWSKPELIGRGKTLRASALVHPLLESPVANNVAVENRSLFITGSNMSGKTTLVRALGVNAVLAQTLHTVCAARWEAPLLRVRSSIGREDSVLEGKSYYLAEVESVRALIDAKGDGRRHLFLLDELFRGTNTTERVAAGAAVLKRLDAGDDIVVVATHDLELLELLGGAYQPFHFRERIEANTLDFDYRMRAGLSSTRNAIALLEFMGYPPEVVADAVANLDWPR